MCKVCAGWVRSWGRLVMCKVPGGAGSTGGESHIFSALPRQRRSQQLCCRQTAFLCRAEAEPRNPPFPRSPGPGASGAPSSCGGRHQEQPRVGGAGWGQRPNGRGLAGQTGQSRPSAAVLNRPPGTAAKRHSLLCGAGASALGCARQLRGGGESAAALSALPHGTVGTRFLFKDAGSPHAD